MTRFLSVPISDAINRNNMRVSISALHNAMRACWPEGIPTHIGHDRHRLAGWMRIFGMHLEPGLARVLSETMIPDTAEEQQALAEHYRNHIKQRTEKQTSLDALILRSELSAFLTGQEEVADLEAAALVGPDLATRVFPELFSKADKDGLIDARELTTVYRGVYQLGALLVFAHPFFRRGLSRLNALNADFLHTLEDLRQIQGCSVRARLDTDAVGLAASARETMEFEYWYGPKFNDDLSSITPELTVHAANEFEARMYQITKTEFWWQSRFNDSRNRSEHILEAEELRDQESHAEGVPEYGCRYVHSIVDDETGRIEHLDGAVRGYDAAAMVRRLDANLKTAGRHTAYTKLWRVDGEIPLGTWKGLVYHYFRDNPLVGEYFGLTPSQDDHNPEAADELEPDLIAKYIPHRIQSGQGVRLTFSYQSPQSLPENERIVWPNRFVTIEGRDIPWLDMEFLEVRKALSQAGLTLTAPDKVRFLALEDRYHEFPLMLHRSLNAVNATLAVYKTLLSRWREKQSDAVFVLGVGLIEEQQIVCLSIFGHLNDILAWLERSAFPPEVSRSEWLEANAEFLSCYPTAGDRPTLNDTISPDGMFEIRRHGLPLTSSRTEVDANRLSNEERLILSEESVSMAPAYEVVRVKCSKCGNDYVICSCSKILDNEVLSEIKSCRLAYIFITDRGVDWELLDDSNSVSTGQS
jgi:hypothetical protein